RLEALSSRRGRPPARHPVLPARRVDPAAALSLAPRHRRRRVGHSRRGRRHRDAGGTGDRRRAVAAGPRQDRRPNDRPHSRRVAVPIACIVAGALAGAGLASWCRPPGVPMMYATLAVPIAAVAAAFVETIPIKLDDNLSVALSAGGVLWLGAMIVARHVDYQH